jgi:predicted dehydrogenase
MSKARIAVIGTGWWSSAAHFPALQRHPDAEVVAICDQREAAVAQTAEAFGIDRTYTDYRELLANETFDGVIIAVWHVAHYEVTRACLEHDLHVMLEKPMVLNAKHAKELVDLAAQRKRELIIGYPYHFAPRVLQAREVIQSGELGDVRYINCFFGSAAMGHLSGDDKPYGDMFEYPLMGPGDVYGDPERSGGGQGHLQITHAAGLMHFITGLRPVSVTALMNNLGTRVDVVDAITARMDNGALANIGSTGTLQLSDSGVLELHVACEHGRIYFDFVTGAGCVHHADGTEEVIESEFIRDLTEGCDQPESLYPLHDTSTNLVDVINGKAENGSPSSFGWWTVELLDAAYRSAGDDGRVVTVASLYD